MYSSPVMIGLQGLEISIEEQEMLQHPLVCGVILFSRNYQSPVQLTELTSAIHALREPALVVAVDHEGGRVQRFREGFTRLPALRRFGEVYDSDPDYSRQLVYQAGWLMATELLTSGVDFSFAPVLDLYHAESQAIAERAFHPDPLVVTELAQIYMSAMQAAGMAAVGKHFPGHGTVTADSHHALPVDKRSYDEIAASDLLPFVRLIEKNIAGIMPAHIVFSQLDAKPACFSEFWLKKILRQQLGFNNIIFSDDLGMTAATTVGDPLVRAEAALSAGCNILLSCNVPEASQQIIDNLRLPDEGADKNNGNLFSQLFLPRPDERRFSDFYELHQSPQWQQAVRQIQTFCNNEHQTGWQDS